MILPLLLMVLNQSPYLPYYTGICLYPHIHSQFHELHRTAASISNYCQIIYHQQQYQSNNSHIHESLQLLQSSSWNRLTDIHMKYQSIGDDLAIEIIDVLYYHTNMKSLKYLNLYGNHISESMISYMNHYHRNISNDQGHPMVRLNQFKFFYGVQYGQNENNDINIDIHSVHTKIKEYFQYSMMTIYDVLEYSVQKYSINRSISNSPYTTPQNTQNLSTYMETNNSIYDRINYYLIYYQMYSYEYFHKKQKIKLIANYLVNNCHILSTSVRIAHKIVDLGIETVADMALLSEEDIQLLQLPIIIHRKLLKCLIEIKK